MGGGGDKREHNATPDRSVVLEKAYQQRTVVAAFAACLEAADDRDGRDGGVHVRVLCRVYGDDMIIDKYQR